MSYGYRNKQINRLEAEIEQLLKQAEQFDVEQDAALGNRRGDELPDELKRREERLVKIQEAKARLQAEARAKAAGIERPMAADSTSAPIPNTADTGHFSKEAVEGLEKLGMDPHLATGRQKHHEPRNWSELGFFNGHRWLVRPSPG